MSELEMHKPEPLQLPDGTYLFNLSSYEPVSLTLPLPEVTEDEVKHALEFTAYQRADLAPIEDRKPHDNDIIVMNITTTMGDKPVDELTGNEFFLELGKGLMPPVFEQSIREMTPGDKAEIAFEAPGAGAAAVFTSQVELLGLRERIIPAVTDTWVSQNFDGLSTVSELATSLRQQVLQEKQAQLEYNKATMVIDEYSKRLVEAIPQDLLEEGYRAFRENLDSMLQMQGSSLEAFYEAQGITETEFVAHGRTEAAVGVQRAAALDALVRHLNLEVEDKEIPELLGVDSSYADQLLQALDKDGSLDEARRSALRNKALRQVAEEAHLTFE